MNSPDNKALEESVAAITHFATAAATMAAYSTTLSEAFSRHSRNTNVAAFAHVFSGAFATASKKAFQDADAATTTMISALALSRTSEEILRAFEKFFNTFSDVMEKTMGDWDVTEKPKEVDKVVPKTLEEHAEAIRSDMFLANAMAQAADSPHCSPSSSHDHHHSSHSSHTDSCSSFD